MSIKIYKFWLLLYLIVAIISRFVSRISSAENSAVISVLGSEKVCLVGFLVGTFSMT